MLGLLKPAAGQVKIFGQDVSQVRQERAHVGYVPQRAVQADLNFPITVREVVSLGKLARKSLFGFENAQERQEIDKAIAMVGIADLQHKRIGELSGGQRQRALIARALVTSPEMLVLDEPTVGVDQLSEQQFYELLRKLNQDLGLTIVLVTHDLDVVSQEVKQLIGVNKQIIFQGTLAELTKKGLFERLYSADKKPIYHGH
jgi:zinc transport system ATP-binding protein